MLALDYHLFQFMPVDLCNENLVVAVDDNGYNECPADGEYTFTSYYTLPEYDEKTSWLSTGWRGQGEITMYATADTTTKIGYCTFQVFPFVTPSSSRGINPPSAATTAAIILGLVGLAIGIGVFCSCRSWWKKPKDDKSETATATDFKRMDDTATEFSGFSSLGNPGSVAATELSGKSGSKV